eukprot:c8451_g1_i2.p1 GENE.c8451_g1_i2~~c8451_g1_i2.p1  ORF type:complete len:532 (+),score=135.99 c8451_g1_i2:332-1927(+)
MFRESVALGAKIPVGNVAIVTVTAGNIVNFDVGAPSLDAVRAEVSTLRNSINFGDFTLAIRARGFPLCTVGSVILGDGVADITMPEPTLKEQLGPPGGPDDEPLTLSEQRERVRVRESMTFGDYTKPGKYNMTRLSPHIFKEGNATYPQQFYVVGRIKFLLRSPKDQFTALYSPLVVRALANATGLAPLNVTVSVHGRQLPNILFHSMVQSEAGDNNDEDGYILVDFEMPLPTLELARKAQSDVVASMSDMLHGFRAFLIQTHSFPSETDFTLLFIEIHGPDGTPVDDCDDEEEGDAQEEDDDLKTLEGKIGQLSRLEKPEKVVVLNVTVVNGKIATESMNEPVNCSQTKQPKITPDLSALPKPLPSNSHNSWPVMSEQPSHPHTMNLPGLDGRIRPDLQTAVQTEVKLIPDVPKPQITSLTTPKPAIKAVNLENHSTLTHARHFVDEPQVESKHDADLGLSSLAQLDVMSPSSESMKSLVASDVAQSLVQDNAWLKSSAESASNEMPEADFDAQAPPGGFPVPDNDEGTL